MEGIFKFLLNIGQKVLVILVILENIFLSKICCSKWKILPREFQEEGILSVNSLRISYIFPNSKSIFSSDIEKSIWINRDKLEHIFEAPFSPTIALP